MIYYVDLNAGNQLKKIFVLIKARDDVTIVCQALHNVLDVIYIRKEMTLELKAKNRNAKCAICFINCSGFFFLIRSVSSAFYDGMGWDIWLFNLA